jgi:hypothetical protein
VQAVLHPLTGRFPGNVGPDVVVTSSLDLVQAAVDAAADVNGDGYIIVGVLPEPAPPGPVLGDGPKKELRIERFYERPFALIGCGVTIIDPANCNSVPPVHIAESAGSPVHPAGSNITLYVLDFGVRSSTSAPGFLVEGDGRQLDEIRAHGNLIGVKILGDDNVVRNGAIDGNLADGLVVEGSGNLIEGTGVFSNGGHGMRVTGDRNKVLASTAGGQLAGNAGDGVNVRGQGNLVRGNAAYGNAGDGIDVGGGTAAAPNLLKKNKAGAPQLGNGAHGILLGGTGSGPSNPVEVDGNQAHGNTRAGIKITGTGHELRDNASGGPGALNAGCEYEVAAGNINATGNKAGSSGVAGADGSPFPAGCIRAFF